jgi:hypothetical protein
MRNSRKKNFTSWTKETSRLAHTAKRAKRLAMEAPAPRRLKEGQYLGTLRWTALSGEITQCVIRQGTRANQIKIGETVCGWDHLMRRMRKSLSRKKEKL